MSQLKRKFDQFDYTCGITASASQVENANDCMRKWWLAKVHKLREEMKPKAEKGDVAHEVFERWLDADDTGRVNGQPVDPFPKGWDDRISPMDSAIIKKVFPMMVQQGVLVRTPGRVVEAAFQIPVLADHQASMIGFIDIQEPGSIVDHKTTGSPKYMKSPKGLSECIQMVTYGCALIAWYIRRGEQPPATIKLRHNQVFLPGDYSDDDPFVKFTEVDVTPEYLTNFWETIIVPLVESMLRLKQAGIEADDWSQVPGPKTKGICRKYGGCPYARICGGTQTVDEYRAHVKRHNETYLATVESETAKMSNTNDILAALAKKKNKPAAVAAPAAAAVAEIPAETAPVAAPVATNHVAETGCLDAAPWANASCLACKGSGVNKKGNACTPCQAATGVTADGFTIEAGEGVINIEADGDVVAQIVVSGEVVVKPTATVAKVEAPAAAPVSAPAAAQAAAVSSATAAVAEPLKGKRGRPKAGFTLVYGTQKRGKVKVLDLHQILLEQGAALAESRQASGYYAMKAFDRRDMLARMADKIADTFGSAVVVVSASSPDLDALACALEPFASSVYVCR